MAASDAKAARGAPVVVKLGTSLVVDPASGVRTDVVAARAAEVAALVQGGTPVCIVSSGAIALGLRRLGLARRPRSLARLQAASALGQSELHRAWETELRSHGVEAAQVLLTGNEIADRTAYVNARNALAALLAVPAVPVINENDAIATDEITFGDNDALAAQVAVLVRARLLVLLTNVRGVLAQPPGTGEPVLIEDGAGVHAAVLGRGSELGRGGMASKVAAAELAAAAGTETVIASGVDDGVLASLVAGSRRGTSFRPSDRVLPAFKLWLRFGKRVAGRIHVDAGALAAVAGGGRSLLAVGVVSVDGDFRAGEGVELVGPDGTAFARGIAAVGRGEAERRRPSVEVVHRDRLVLLDDAAAQSPRGA